MSKKRIFKSLKIENIYLKSLNYTDFENLSKLERLNVSNNITIELNEIDLENKRSGNVHFVFEKSVLVNDGEKANIDAKIGIQIQVDFGNNDIKNIDEVLKEICKKIIDANALNTKISLLIGNVTGSFGDIPIMLPLDLYEVEKD